MCVCVCVPVISFGAADQLFRELLTSDASPGRAIGHNEILFLLSSSLAYAHQRTCDEHPLSSKENGLWTRPIKKKGVH